MSAEAGALPAPPGRPDQPDEGVELLERALAYTRGALVSVRPEHLALRTPCAGWRLGDLLAHMEDALDAFAEGADGAIGLHSAAPAPLEERVRALQAKACGLLGAWSAATTPTVLVGGHPIRVGIVTRLAALEILVHGWDVARTTGRREPIPDALGAELLPTALALARETAGDFAPPVRVAAGAAGAVRLLAAVGRRA